MFRNPFSFSGRIRRLEFGLSYFFLLASFLLFGLFAEAIGDSSGALMLCLIIPAYWFIFAQSAKRCHDVGNSGWYQLIPFYGLFLLFEDGKRGPNQYGEDPKGILSPRPPATPWRIKIALPENKNLTKLAIEMTPFALFNTWLIVFTEQLGKDYILISLIGLFVSVILCYFMLLYFSFNGRPVPELATFMFRHHLAYAVLVYLLATLYGIAFQNEGIALDNIVWGFILTVFILGFTYIGSWCYQEILTKMARDDSK